MKSFCLALSAMFWAFIATAQPSANQPSAETPKVAGIQYDDYHGINVADPYRIYERTDHPVTRSNVRQQNQATDAYFKNIPYYSDILNRLTKLANFERFGRVKPESDGWVYFMHNTGLQNQPVLYRQKGLPGAPQVVLDPNTLSADGSTPLTDFNISLDNRFMAYTYAPKGSDVQIAQVLELGTGRILPDRLTGLKFSSLAWKGDGFYYQRFPESDLFDPTKGARVFYHRLGQEQSLDELIFEDAREPKMMFGFNTYAQERYLVITGGKSTSDNSLFVLDLKKAGSKFIPIVPDAETADYEVVGIENDLLYVRTNDAPNGRLVEIDLKNPARAQWRTLLPEQPNSVLQNCWLAGGRFVAHYLVNCVSTLQVFDLKGKALGIVDLPAKTGQVTEFNGLPDKSEAFFAFETFTTPSSIYRFDLKTLQVTAFKSVKSAFDSDAYETIQKIFKSKDGTLVSMFITYKKGIVLNGKNPCLQYGYGGFASPVLPRYRLLNVAFLESGGIYVSVNIRGGNEFGKKWHEMGVKASKQNVFDDFIAASEYLIREGYTSNELLAINGASNGGLLVGAVMTQRPDLYRVALPQVGVLDMLRYQESTVGAYWDTDYGTSKTEEGFKYLYKYSPLHNIKPLYYPATLVMTGAEDDRVAPWHSYKFAATLQDAQQGENPILLRVTHNAGHGGGKSTTVQVEEAACMLAFTLHNMGLDY